MRNAVLLALTVALSGLVTLARAQPDERERPDPGRSPAAPADVPLPREPLQPRPPAPGSGRTCADIEADARALLDGARSCASNEDCALLSFAQLLGPESCIAAFQCTTAVSTDLDRAGFLEVAAPLVVEKRACGECAVAACVPPTDLVPACVQGTCEILAR